MNPGRCVFIQPHFWDIVQDGITRNQALLRVTYYKLLCSLNYWTGNLLKISRLVLRDSDLVSRIHCHYGGVLISPYPGQSSLEVVAYFYFLVEFKTKQK